MQNANVRRVDGQFDNAVANRETLALVGQDRRQPVRAVGIIVHGVQRKREATQIDDVGFAVGVRRTDVVDERRRIGGGQREIGDAVLRYLLGTAD